MKFKIDQDLFKYAFYSFLVIAASILFYQILKNLGFYFTTIGQVLMWMRRLLGPFITGVILAYILNPAVRSVEKNMDKIKFISSQRKVKRAISILSIYALALIFIIMSLVVIIPNLIENVSDLLKEWPTYMDSSNQMFNDLRVFFEDRNLGFILFEAESFINSLLRTSKDSIEGGSEFIFNSGAIFSRARGFTLSLFNMIIGMIMAIYLLFDKELFKRNIKRFLLIFLSNKQYNMIIDFGSDADKLFGDYIIGRSIDSLIIGSLSFIGFTLIGIEFRLLFAVIIGVTNLIPYVGPFIGGIPVTILALFGGFADALWTGLLILGLQQFDGWILGPKILGDSVGIRPIWIILSILVGGSLFGVLGMFLGVPIFAIITMLIDRLINRVHKMKNIDFNEYE